MADDELIRLIVDAMSEVFAGVGTTILDPDEARAQVKSQEVPLPPIDVTHVADELVGDAPVRRYQPAEQPASTVLVFAHGGGWVLCDLDTHDRLCRKLANELRVDVVSVDYRRAPEHRFPAALDDVVAVVRWAASRWDRVAVGGDSAGGNLAAAACLAIDDVPLAAQLLIYPVLDSRMDTPSYRENATGWFLTADQMAWYWRCYLGDADGTDPLAAPLRATDDQLAPLPPTVVVTAEHDPLRDEGEAYAARLAAAGVPVELVQAPGLFHAFFSLDDVLPPAAGPVAKAIAAVRGLLS